MGLKSSQCLLCPKCQIGDGLARDARIAQCAQAFDFDFVDIAFFEHHGRIAEDADAFGRTGRNDVTGLAMAALID